MGYDGKTITVRLHHCSREERKDLEDYLDNASWDFTKNYNEDGNIKPK